VGDFSSSRTIVRFGKFELDQDAGELRREGTKVRLQEQPLQILQMLLEQPGKVVQREELRKRIWPSDTFVDFDHGINNAIKRLREALGDTAETPRYVETLPRRGYRFVGNLQASSPAPSSQIQSLAVLPLENLSPDPEQEYFTDGLTEALITSLAKVGALRVVSRTSAMHYKGVHRPVREIARELEVDAVVEGTVLRSGERVRISAQLIDARSDTHIWAESYERSLRDVLALHSEVAQAIAKQIQVTLTPQEQAHFASSRQVDPNAYEAYLKGRYHWDRRTGDGLPKAARYFQEAIGRDPSFAAAYSGLADSVSGLGVFGFVSPSESFGKARDLAQRAVELEPGLSEAHASLAWTLLWYDFDFPKAEREFERAVELNPRYATAHGWFGWYLALMGRYEEAYTECQRALRLEPLSSAMQYALGCVYWMAHRYDQAIEHLERALDFEPNFSWSHGFIGFAYQGKCMYEPAVAALQRAVELSPRSTMSLLGLAEAYALAGKRDEAQKIVGQIDNLSREQYVTPYFRARVHAALGEHDTALDWLETSYQERMSHMAFLKVDPQFDKLRTEARFQNLIQRMNFPG
jgi:TolB-like protein/Tfp pilus assembly protein PilF